MARTLIGGPALRARLNAIHGVPAAFADQWATEAAQRMERTHPPADRPASRKFTTKATRTRAGVYGAFWWVFVDRGTKAHDITPRKGKALRWEQGGQTIFARKVHLRRKARRPFITKASQEALGLFNDLVVQSWNRKRLRTRTRFL